MQNFYALSLVMFERDCFGLPASDSVAGSLIAGSKGVSSRDNTWGRIVTGRTVTVSQVNSPPAPGSNPTTQDRGDAEPGT